jgi:hypothetical protein
MMMLLLSRTTCFAEVLSTTIRCTIETERADRCDACVHGRCGERNYPRGILSRGIDFSMGQEVACAAMGESGGRDL